MKIRIRILGCAILLAFVLFANGCAKEKARTFDVNFYSYDFCEGVAWVQLYDRPFLSRRENGVVCIDENGVEIFNLPEVNKDEVSNFYNGIALIDSRYIISKEGTILHDLKEKFDIEIIMLPDHYFDGFIFVRRIVNDVIMTGVMNSDLEWQIEPTSKLEDFEVKANFLYYFYSMGYYDALSNEFINENEFQYRHIQRSFQESGMIFWDKSYDGTFSYACEYMEERGNINLPDSYRTGLYNKNLELVLDLSQYDSVMSLSDFQNDKCLIEFSASNEELYAGVINTDGEFIFLHKGVVQKFDGEKIEFWDCYFDWNGKRCEK